LHLNPNSLNVTIIVTLTNPKRIYMNVLHIQVSPNAQGSASRNVSNYLVNKFKEKNPATTIISRDLDQNPLPHLSGITVGASYTAAESRTPEQKEAIKLSDSLVKELLDSQVIVISSPMWNFGMPSVLKAWVDHIVRAGVTFSFGPDGLKGLVAGKKAYLVLSSGSVFSEGPFASYDQFVPSVKTALGFIGITDVEVVRVEGTNDPAKAAVAISAAKSKADALSV
jgi:FMN-dependent NADH-azoreductase